MDLGVFPTKNEIGSFIVYLKNNDAGPTGSSQQEITKSLNIIPVEWIDEVISSALVDEPTPISKKIKQQKNKTPRKAINKPAH